MLFAYRPSAPRARITFDVRLRMDTTTNWAVSMTSVLTVFSLGQTAVPHYFFAFIVFMNLIFMVTEARHFAVFLIHRKRVRLLERGFYCVEVRAGGSLSFFGRMRACMHACCMYFLPRFFMSDV